MEKIRKRYKTEESVELKTQFGIWLGLPDEGRAVDEKTINQFGKKYHITPKTLYVWRREPFVLEVEKNALKILGGNEKLSVIKAITEAAKKGNVQAQRLYLEWQGEIGMRRQEGNKIMDWKVDFATETER